MKHAQHFMDEKEISLKVTFTKNSYPKNEV